MSNADWWAKQLGAQPAPVQQRPVNNPMPPSQQPMTQFTPPQPAAPSAPSAQRADYCPSCNSGNYMRPNANTEFRCYDCGYPREQSGGRFGALTGAKVEGAAKGAIGNTTGGFNPMPAGYNPDGTKQ